MIQPLDVRRRTDAYTPLAPELGPAPAPAADLEGPPPADERPLYLVRPAYVERDSSSGQVAPESCTVPDPGAVDRIGAGTPIRAPQPTTSSAGDASARGTPVGIGGVRRSQGIDALGPDEISGLGDLAVTGRLLRRATERYGNGDGLRVQIGEETLTMGQLKAQIERDPERFADTLRRQGISVAEFNEVLDDALASNVPSGTTLDLRAGSDLANAYRIGGPDGATVDSHYDRAATEASARGQSGAESRASLRGERVERPGFFQMIADAFAELAGLIARAFGSSWNPDTATFDGQVNDAHFRELGANAARGPEGLALQALLQQPGGEAQLRSALLAQRPESASELQWTRAVNDYLSGLTQGLSAERSAGRMPELSAAEGAEVALYLRSQGYSAAARQDVERVLAQAQPIRGQALSLLNELPAAERANLVALLTPPGERPARDATDEAFRTFHAQTLMSTGTPAERAALFETMRVDGFRHGPSTSASADVVDAITAGRRVPEGLRDRYLALIPRLGVERAYLANDPSYGIAHHLQNRTPEEGARFLSDIEARAHSTEDLERGLVRASFHLELTRPNAGLVPAADRARIVRSFEAHNLSFSLNATDGSPLRIVPRGAGDASTISLDRYFRDSAYREATLARTGLNREAFERMLQNVAATVDRSGNEGGLQSDVQGLAEARARLSDPTLSAEDRRSAEFDQRFQRLDILAQEGAQNIEIDLSSGSAADRLFGLHQAGVRPGIEASKLEIANSSSMDISVTLRGPARSGGRPGAEHTVSFTDLANVLQHPPEGQTPEQAFRARWPGLDFGETVQAFAQISLMVRNGSLETADDGSLRLDLRGRHANPALNTLGAQLRDGTIGNVPAPSGLTADLGSRSTADISPVDRMWSTAASGAAAGNNFYQYGWFAFGGPTATQGYYDTQAASADARARYVAGGSRPDPAHVMNALYGLDSFGRIDGGERQLGLAVGSPESFLRDPRTGLPARGQDFSVLTFSGTGSAAQRQAFDQSAQRVRDMFTRYGGVPESQVEHLANPTPETMYAAIEGEILRDPRAPADRDRARTVVVHYAGHTTSDQADGVLGMAFDVNGQRRYFTPEMVARLTALAHERGVNLMWVTDACRAGEYANQPQAELRRAADASGTSSPTLTSLESLRAGVRDYHQSLMALRSLPSAQMHAPTPGWRELEGLGRAALAEAAAGGGSTTALDALRARRDAVLASGSTTPTERRIMTQYVAAVETMIRERGNLARAGGMDNIINHGVLTGATTWAPDRPFKTQVLGQLEDRLMTEIRARTPAIEPAVDRRRP
ncbi:MAG: caspase family protein [Myxococcota bacterium]